MLLRDGHPVHLRPITPDDGEALREFHGRLSAQTVYFRFFSTKPRLTDADVEYFTRVDHRSRVALIALERDSIVGVGRFDAIGDGTAEVAFIIRDDMQGRGLGSVFLEHLAAAAREVGVRRFLAEVLPENSRMLATFREAGYEVQQRREEDVVAVGFDIEPTAASVSVMEAREHRSEARSMERMLSPECVAVVGASRTSGGLGHAVLTHLADGGFTGLLIAVHPEVDEIAGVPCVRSLAAAQRPIDLAVVVVPAAQVPAVLQDAAAAGVHGLVVVSGGFGDSGPQGLDLQRELVATVNRTGMRLVGPNALGILNTDPAVRLNASLVPRMPAIGSAGFFCQSGALGSSILDRFAAKGLGVSSVVSAGNRADVSGNDLLQFWEEDPRTEVVLLHLETIGNARKFARLVHRLAKTKPVVMVRAGGAGLRHPLGHAVVSSSLGQHAVDQILADCGLVVVEGVDRMIDVARVVVGQPLPASPGVAIVSNSDALSALAANALVAHGLELVEPLVAFAREESPTAYTEAIRMREHDPSVGAVLAIYVPPIEEPAEEAIRRTLRSCADCGEDRHAPVVAVMAARPGGEEPGGLPVFADVEDAVRALADAHAISVWRAADARRSSATDEPWSGDLVEVPAGPGVLTADDAAHIVTRAGATRIVCDLDASGVVGCDIRLVDDPLFGAVVTVAVDDEVADLLGDREHRLAPVTCAGALDMISSLRASALLTRGSDHADSVLEGLARAISDVSHLHQRAPGVREATLRHATRRASGDVTVGEITVVVGQTAAAADPTARRL